jgi:hypothetical protein
VNLSALFGELKRQVIPYVYIGLYHICRAFEKIKTSKSSPNLLIFSLEGFFDMGNSNLKELVDFNHKKVPIRWVYSLKKFHNEDRLNSLKSVSGKFFYSLERHANDSPPRKTRRFPDENPNFCLFSLQYTHFFP